MRILSSTTSGPAEGETQTGNNTHTDHDNSPPPPFTRTSSSLTPHVGPERDAQVAEKDLELGAEGAVRLGEYQHPRHRDVALYDRSPSTCPLFQGRKASSRTRVTPENQPASHKKREMRDDVHFWLADGSRCLSKANLEKTQQKPIPPRLHPSLSVSMPCLMPHIDWSLNSGSVAKRFFTSFQSPNTLRWQPFQSQNPVSRGWSPSF